MRIYTAGPMSGHPDLNYPAFAEEAARLRAGGFDVVSPAELNAGMEHEGWHACMKRDIVALLGCDAIALLSGREKSKGATLELKIARGMGMRVFYPASTLLEV